MKQDIQAVPNQTVSITGYNSDGEGVARLADRRVVFIRGAARGDICEIVLTQSAARWSRAGIIKVLQPSPHRISPDCEVYPQCGGCDFRHLTYSEELHAKKDRVNAALSRIGKTELLIDKVLTTGQISGYRNKAVFHVAQSIVGFHSAGTNDVCPVRNCVLLPDELNAMLRDLWENPPPDAQPVTVRTEIPNIGGVSFFVSPDSFFQVNNAAAEILCEKVRGYAELSKSDTLVDLYCGCGFFTLLAGQDAGRAIGVESNRTAVKDARESTRRNGFTHMEFICADAASWDSSDIRPSCVIVDPPRKGLSKAAIRKIAELRPARIVYVSCNPATMARDIKLLNGYTPKSVCAVDMFPRTANIECCMLLMR